MTNEGLRTALYDAYMRFYVEGFKANDMGLLNQIVRYPIAYIKNGSVSMCDRYPVDPGEIKAQKQWDHSTDWKFEIKGINEQEAHAVATATRRRQDGSKIENVHGFYAFTMTEDGWKMYAVADVTF